MLKRLPITVDEGKYMLEILDNWIEGYKETAVEAADDEVPQLVKDMERAMVIREKVRRYVRRR